MIDSSVFAPPSADLYEYKIEYYYSKNNWLLNEIRKTTFPSHAEAWARQKELTAMGIPSDIDRHETVIPKIAIEAWKMSKKRK